MDLALNDTYTDLAMAGGDLITLTGRDETRQRIVVACRTGLGEWAFDINHGVSYLHMRSDPRTTDGLIRGDIVRVVSAVPGVRAVRTVDVRRDTLTRTVRVSVIVDLADGSKTEITV